MDKNFMDRVLAGEAEPGDIDDYVEAWHKETDFVGDLSSFLGLDRAEYESWLKDPGAIEKIVRNRSGIKFHTLADGDSPLVDVTVYPTKLYVEQEVEAFERISEGRRHKVTVSLSDNQGYALYEILKGIYEP